MIASCQSNLQNGLLLKHAVPACACPIRACDWQCIWLFNCLLWPAEPLLLSAMHSLQPCDGLIALSLPIWLQYTRDDNKKAVLKTAAVVGFTTTGVSASVLLLKARCSHGA